MTECSHEEVLFIPQGAQTRDDGYKLLFVEPKFLCIACREYVSQPSRKRLVNVPQYDPEECVHPDKIYTMGSRWVCLNCGSNWIPEPPKLDLKVNPEWEAEDKRFRDEWVDNWLAREKEK